jgi:hypothetical protein
MNRRGFLKWLGIAPVASAVSLEIVKVAPPVRSVAKVKTVNEAQTVRAVLSMGDYVPGSFVLPQNPAWSNLSLYGPQHGLYSGNKSALLVAEVTDCPVR